MDDVEDGTSDTRRRRSPRARGASGAREVESIVMLSRPPAVASVVASAPGSGRHHRRASSAGSYSGAALLAHTDDADDGDDDGARDEDDGEDGGDRDRGGDARGAMAAVTGALGAMVMTTGARGDGAAVDGDGDVDGASEAKTDTPGKGLPWSPRLASVMGDERAKIKARSRREGRGSDADVITQFLGDETSEATTTTTAAAAGSTNRTREKSHNKSTSSSSPWSTLVSYLRCCVVPKTYVLESELEGVGAEDAEAEAKSVSSSSSSAATCVPCTSQPRVCFNENFTLHSGDPFIGERALGCAKPCLVLDLDETLVHSSFKPVLNPDYIVPVEIDGKMTDVHVLKRPWVDLFMREVAKDWEIVLFTASLPKYADPVLDLLDATKTISWRLFRRHCYAFQGNYVKDLTCLGRDLKKTVIVDNSPYSYAFHPQNAFPITSFIDNPNDNELLNAIPYLRELAHSEDVTRSLHRNRGYLPRQSYFSRKGCEPPALDRLGQSI